MKKASIFLLSLCWIFAGLAYAQGRDKVSQYVYEDTKELVLLVEDAASLIERKGEMAFGDFGVKGSRWFKGESYLFVYDLSGKCVFHPVEPDLVGQNLIGLKDFNGRPAIKLITDIGKKPETDASDWVFYLWEGPVQTPRPSWKSSYVRKAVAPDGTVYVVGSGLYNMKVELVFIENCVDEAVELILTKGKEAAFDELRTISCPLHILGAFIVVADSKGDMVVDPSFPTLAKKRNTSSIRDNKGRPVIDETMETLEGKDRICKLYICPKPDANRFERRLVYMRKVKIGNEVFYVWSDFAPATPIWMKR